MALSCDQQGDKWWQRVGRFQQIIDPFLAAVFHGYGQLNQTDDDV